MNTCVLTAELPDMIAGLELVSVIPLLSKFKSDFADTLSHVATRGSNQVGLDINGSDQIQIKL